MKTGIVFEINKDKATIMQNGGAFIKVKASPSWRIGDIVTIEDKKINYNLVYVAACFALFIFTGIFGFTIYFQETSLISMDVNPSIEIGLNRFNRVINYTSRNDEASKISNLLSIKNKTYDEAVKLLLEDDILKKYLTEKSYFVFAIQSDDAKDKDDILEKLKSILGEETNLKNNEDKSQVIFYIVDKTIVEEAHAQHTTPGKYMSIQELIEIQPDIKEEDYINKSVGEIQKHIHDHLGGDNHDTPSTDIQKENNANTTEIPHDAHEEGTSSEYNTTSDHNNIGEQEGHNTDISDTNPSVNEHQNIDNMTQKQMQEEHDKDDHH